MTTAAPGFSSVDEVTRAHKVLLERYRASGGQPGDELLDEISSFMEECREYGGFVDSAAVRQALEGIIDYWWVIDYRAGRQQHGQLALADFDPSRAPELADDTCPYVGLDAFGEDTQHVFFGRTQLVHQIIDRLKQQRLLVVVGPSGSGKSSLVMGGVLPTLRTEIAGTDSWCSYPPIAPGPGPLRTLADLFRSADTPPVDEWFAEQAAKFCSDSAYLSRLVQARGSTAVIVVDQFEEVFTRCTDDAARQAFVDNLVELSQVPGARHTVILTLRVDFEIQVARVPRLHQIYETARIGIIAPSALELREAIEEPAQLVGLKIQPTVVDALVKEILGEPAGLPLLQFALRELWDHRDRNRITYAAYERLGGARMALANCADEVFRNLSLERQNTARRVLLSMARAGEGLEVTSNRVRREALLRSGEASERVNGVLDELVKTRLVRMSHGATPADDQFEVAHEALLRNWPRVADWLDEERVQMRRKQRLTDAAEHWLASGRDADALWRGSQLEEALSFSDLNEIETAFIQASQEAGASAQREREAARERALAQAQELAEEQKRRAEAEWQRAELQRERAEQEAIVGKRLRRLAIVAAMAQAVIVGILATRFVMGLVVLEYVALVAQVLWIVLVLFAAITSLAVPTVAVEATELARRTGDTRWRRIRPWWWIVLLNVLSLGLFNFFWLFATWRELKLERANRRMHPVWHVLALAVPIYGWFRLHAHARTIVELSESVGARPTLRPLLWTMMVVLFPFLGWVVSAHAPIIGLLALTSIGVSGVGSLAIGGVVVDLVFQTSLMLWAQSDLNRAWRSAPHGKPSTRIHPLKWGAVGLLAMMWILVVIAVSVASSSVSSANRLRAEAQAQAQAQVQAQAKAQAESDRLLRQAEASALAHNIGLARQQYADAVTAATPTTFASTNNKICWFGSIDGFADVVMPACERAVALETQTGDSSYVADFRDSRGLARALTGDTPGAIEDFTWYIGTAQTDPNLKWAAQRQQFVDALTAGQNPFDQATLESLRSQ